MISDDLRKAIYLSAFKGNLSVQKEDDSSVDKSLNILLTSRNIDKKEIKKRKINDEFCPDYDIPATWKWVKMGLLCDVIRGLTFSNSYSEKKDNNILVLRGGNIDSKSEKLIFTDNIYVDKNIPNSNQYLHVGDTLIVASSGTKTSVGKSTFIDEIDSNVSFGGFMMVVRPYSEIINPRYLSYNIKVYRNKIINNTNGYISNITNSILNNLLIPLPPIEEQQRIVDKIEELFAKLDEIKPIEEELNHLKDNFPNDMIISVLNDAYTGKLTNQNISCWNSNKLNDCCIEIVTGNSISESIKKLKYTNIKAGYNYIATKDLEFNHTFNYNNGIKIPFDEKGFKYARENDILLCVEGGSAGKKIGILNETVCYGNKLCRFSTNQNVLPKFLYYYLQSPIFLKNFNSNLSGIIGGVSINKIKNIELKYPSIEEQQKIVDKIEQLLPLCNDIKKLISE